MCIGYIKVPHQDYEQLKHTIIEIKERHRTPTELKWNKLSRSRLPLYKELIDLFFTSSLQFRCIIIKYKDRLNHEDFNQGSHDNFYYKMIYYLLRFHVSEGRYRVFLDIKDTHGKEKLNKIEEIFQNHYLGNSPFVSFQHLRSHENVFFQIVDLLIGAVTYRSRPEYNEQSSNPIKVELIKYLEEKSGFTLNEGTEPWEIKFNIFDHQPKRKIE
jgi:hypothetical protein